MSDTRTGLRPCMVLPRSSKLSMNEEGKVERRFHYWAGSSGRHYLHSVFRSVDVPGFAHANILVARRWKNRREVLFIGRCGADPESFYTGAAYLRALLAGGNEVHVHLLGQTEAARRRIEDDLRAALEPDPTGAQRGSTRIMRPTEPDPTGAQRGSTGSCGQNTAPGRRSDSAGPEVAPGRDHRESECLAA